MKERLEELASMINQYNDGLYTTIDFESNAVDCKAGTTLTPEMLEKAKVYYWTLHVWKNGSVTIEIN